MKLRPPHIYGAQTRGKMEWGAACGKLQFSMTFYKAAKKPYFPIAAYLTRGRQRRLAGQHSIYRSFCHQIKYWRAGIIFTE